MAGMHALVEFHRRSHTNVQRPLLMLPNLATTRQNLGCMNQHETGGKKIETIDEMARAWFVDLSFQ